MDGPNDRCSRKKHGHNIHITVTMGQEKTPFFSASSLQNNTLQQETCWSSLC
jgi:6-pyruvoyl-tetrahydropterin synthase